MELDNRHGGSQITPARPPLSPDMRDGDVRQQLERIKGSSRFRSSRRSVQFLDFVVQAALDGRLESLKERTIGVEVFGRDPNYDTNQDPVVRGTASEVRKRLAQYYQMPGHERELRIDLPAGSYLPEFHWPAELPATSAEITKPRSATRRWLWPATLFTVGAALLILLFVWPATHKAADVVDEFWAPLMQNAGPVLLCVGQPKVYNIVGPLEAELQKRMPGPDHPRPAADVANEKVSATLSEFVPNWDRYLALGDAICLSDMAAFLAQRGRVYHIRGGGSTSFADLRENPAVLIGAFTNNWTMRLTGQERFTFAQDLDRGVHYVRDQRNPNNRDWQLANVWPDWKMPIDYAIVSRVFDPTTGKVFITAAGITQYGTAAAGEFLVNPVYLSQLTRNAPRDWQEKNIQVVLSTKVIEGTAGPPQVLATHFW